MATWHVSMRPCFHIEIVTPKKIVLNGLWFGPAKPKKVIIFIHGLTASAFSMKRIVDELVNRETAVVTFNNRGFEQVTEIKRIVGKKSRYVQAGAGHEVFTECVDDIQGAINFAKKTGAKNIFLAGHSTGCQKAIFWASRKGKGVRGIILLAPVSDWAAEVMLQGKKRLDQTASVARAFVRSGRKHDLLPKGKVTKRHETFDAQRILSLYTPDSLEEIFPYAQPKKNPRTFSSVRTPLLVLWAEKDEYSSKPIQEIASWFEEHLYTGEVVIVPKVGHSFKGGEKTVAGAIRRFMASDAMR